MSLRTRSVVLRRNAYARKDFLVIFTKLDSRLADYKPAYPLSQALVQRGGGGRRNPSIVVLNRIATALSSARFENFSVKTRLMLSVRG